MLSLSRSLTRKQNARMFVPLLNFFDALMNVFLRKKYRIFRKTRIDMHHQKQLAIYTTR